MNFDMVKYRKSMCGSSIKAQNKYEKRKKTMEKESKEEKAANGHTIGKKLSPAD